MTEREHCYYCGQDFEEDELFFSLTNHWQKLEKGMITVYNAVDLLKLCQACYADNFLIMGDNNYGG